MIHDEEERDATATAERRWLMPALFWRASTWPSGGALPLRFAACVGRFYEDLASDFWRRQRASRIAGVPEANVTQASVPGAYECRWRRSS